MDKVIEPGADMAAAIAASTSAPVPWVHGSEGMPGETSATWLDVGGRAVLTRLHRPSDGRARGAVLILLPAGMEELVTHRFAMAQAARLVRAGFVVARIGWSGASASATPAAGAPPAPTRWRQEILAALDLLAQVVPGCPPSVVAVGVSGALVAQAVGEAGRSLSCLVLVAPVGRGRTYLRSRAALLRVSAQSEGVPEVDPLGAPGSVALPGVAFDAAEVADWAAVDLARCWSDGLAEDVVVVAGPDAPADRPTRTFLAAADGHTWSAEGLTVQLDRPSLFTVARLDVADAVAEHLAGRAVETREVVPPELRRRAVVMTADGVDVEDELVSVCGLPAVVTHAVGEPRRVLVWATSSTEPHSGAGGVWARLARELALRGVTTVRVDIKGYGELVLVDDPRDPSPHDPRAVDQYTAVARWAAAQFGLVPDVGGMCSGSWIAMGVACRIPCRSIVSVSHGAWTNDADLIAPDTLPGAGPMIDEEATGAEDPGRPLVSRLAGSARARARSSQVLRRVLAAGGLVQSVEESVRQSTSGGAQLHLLMGDVDATMYDERGGDVAWRRLRARGVTMSVERDHLVDHAVLTPYARSRSIAFVVGHLGG
ncbi:hypothetical protein [Arsenicicoccus dermatophilus]|uniref:hypothetical protein n=1 Tax=Arsenicicoccus dermatophilus TaxID=1076331 RepID=UPI00391766E3